MMKHIPVAWTGILSSILLSWAPASALLSSPSLHHDLTITLNPEQQSLSGLDTVLIRGLEKGRIEMTLAPHARIRDVAVQGQKAPFTFQDGVLILSAPSTTRKDGISVTIGYDAVFRDPVPKDPIHTEDPSYGVLGTISTEGAFLLSGADWYPDIPGARSTFTLHVKAPAGFEAVTAGKRVERKTEGTVCASTWEIKTDPKGLSLSAGPYVVTERQVLGTDVYTYLFAEDNSLARSYLDATARYLEFYSGLFGPYPFEKFAVVANFFPTGYGFPSYTLLGRTVLRLPFILETSLGHEVAHCWWGNGVLVDYRYGNWSEGLTSYVADYLYKEQESAEEARGYRIKALWDYAALVPPDKDFPLAEFLGRMDPSTRAIGYGKSAMVFHMARRLAGDGPFWAALRDVYEQKRFERASWADFAAALAERTGKSFTPFFDQWVTRPGAPKLTLKNVVAEKTDKGWRVTAIVVQERPFFELSLPIRLETTGAPLETAVTLASKEVAFTLEGRDRPVRLEVDPERDVFRRLEQSEIPPAINSIKGSTSLAVIRARSLPPDAAPAADLLVEALGHRGAPIVSEKDAVPLLEGPRDLLYLGLPAEKGFVVPEGIALKPDAFAIQDRGYDQEEDALFSVFSDRHRPGRVIAVFLPLSAKAADAALRKISHYGKYSYVVFRSGVNQDKGIWEVTASPLIHRF